MMTPFWERECQVCPLVKYENTALSIHCHKKPKLSIRVSLMCVISYCVILKMLVSIKFLYRNSNNRCYKINNLNMFMGILKILSVVFVHNRK